MIEKKKLKKLFVYGNLKNYSKNWNKLYPFFFSILNGFKKCFKRKNFDLNLRLSKKNNYKCLDINNFLYKKNLLKKLIGLDIFFIIKTGKNLFIHWLDVFGRLKLTKSLMTLKDPKRNITKKQKSFSVYFLLKKFGTVLRKRYRLRKIALLLKGSVGIRRKKSFISSLVHSGLKIKYITDITNVPFNGCRLKKKKRL
jgi:ribosomal protein S11